MNGIIMYTEIQFTSSRFFPTVAVGVCLGRAGVVSILAICSSLSSSGSFGMLSIGWSVAAAAFLVGAWNIKKKNLWNI